MQLSVNPLLTIEAYEDERLSLVNGIAVLGNGNVVVADGGNDKIRLFSSSGRPVQSIGGKGLGEYRFKEPVGVFVSPDQRIFVADWHNHRIAIYDANLAYIDEFGHFGSPFRPRKLSARTRQAAKLLRNLAFTGSYIRAHFPADAPGSMRKQSRRYSYRLLIEGLSYWRRRHGSVAKALAFLCSSEFSLDKPNGVAFGKDTLIVSQKNSRCLSVHEDTPPYSIIDRWFAVSDRVPFGRLGNVICDPQGHVLVCDEPAGKIWRIDAAGGYLGEIVGEDSGIGVFAPFSCCLISRDLLCVCGGRNFQIMDLSSREVLFCSAPLGELHGAAFDAQREILYLADRLHDMIRAYTVSRK